MENLSQFPLMFMICHFSYEKYIVWGETQEIKHIQIVRGPKYWLENAKKNKHATGMHLVIDAWPI